MKRRRGYVSFSLAVVFSFLICGSGYSGEVRGVTDTAIKIGGIMDQTGPVADIGILLAEAAKNYIHHINDHGGVHGRKIK